MPSVDLSELIDDMVKYGRSCSTGSRTRQPRLPAWCANASYDADAWMKDVNDFWDNVRKDAVRAAEYWRDKFPAK